MREEPVPERPVREARRVRATTETSVDVSLALDGAGVADVKTGIRFFDHVLSLWCFHSRCNLTLAARSLDGIAHHVVEDAALALGEAVYYALADRRGIVRYGFAILPMDDALARVAVDISGRPYARTRLRVSVARIEDLDSELVSHFFSSFAQAAGLCVHADVIAGRDAHHCVEALFKAAGIACAAAWTIDTRRADQIRSTKGTLS